ncbi:MAG TPA: dTDP-4-dehydrorhamnose reductase [Planctomycetota bacterium]|nr:dTDP-4-dehydrorhamnose reductase [Planctomycetota bacterium]
MARIPLSGKKVLVTGANGRLGSELVTALKERGANVKGVGRADFDLGGRDGVLDAVKEHGPEVIFHAAALTAVDDCEEDPDLAYRINALGTRNVCEAAEQAGARVIYISTDHVFSGRKKGPYDEFDEPDPINIYGRSKLWGERYVLRLGPRHSVVRTSRLFGGHGRNYIVSTLEKVRSLPRADQFVAVHDQLAVPTYAPDLAQRVCDVSELGGGGIYHLVSAGPACSWADLASRTIALAGLDVRVRAITSDERPRAARPMNGVLLDRVSSLEGLEPLPSWTERLESYVRSLGK